MAFMVQDMLEKRMWLRSHPNGDLQRVYSGEFTEEEAEMGKKVWLVIVTRDGDSIPRVRHACTDYQDACRKSRAIPRTAGSSTVEEMQLEDPAIVVAYRVWVTFGEDGPYFEAEERRSIPMAKDVFEPLEPQAKSHGSITVDAGSEEQAIVKAKNILIAYLTGGAAPQQASSPAVPRR